MTARQLIRASILSTPVMALKKRVSLCPAEITSADTCFSRVCRYPGAYVQDTHRSQASMSIAYSISSGKNGFDFKLRLSETERKLLPRRQMAQLPSEMISPSDPRLRHLSPAQLSNRTLGHRARPGAS